MNVCINLYDYIVCTCNMNLIPLSSFKEFHETFLNLKTIL